MSQFDYYKLNGKTFIFQFLGMVFTMLMATRACALELGENLHLHGFFSQGFIQTSDNRWFGDSENGSWDFREIGLNLSTTINPRARLAIQGLSRSAGEMADGELMLDFGLLDLTVLETASNRTGLRLGRFKNPLGLYNDTRDVPFTRPSIFLPQSIYLDRTRNLFLSTDGLAVYSDLVLDQSDLSFVFGAGYPSLDDNVEYTIMGQNRDGFFEPKDISIVGRVLFEHDGGRIRTAVSGAKGSSNFVRGPADPPPPLLNSGSVDFSYYILSFQYNAEKWSFSTEYARQFTSNNLGLLFPKELNPVPEAYFLQGSYRINQDFELMLRYDVSYRNKNDRDGERWEAMTRLPAHSAFAKDWTVGLRWDITDDIMVRLEYHNIEGTNWVSLRENDQRDTTRFWDMYSVLATIRF